MKLIICFFGAMALLGCSHIDLSTEKSGSVDWLTPERLGWKLQNAGKPYSLTRTTIDGREALRFEIRQGDTWEERSGRKSFRTEVATDEFPPMGSERWYRFSIFLPSNFPIEDNRLVLAQWWAKTKRNLGEIDRSPILHLRFGNGKLAILLRRYPDKITHDDQSYIQRDLFDTTVFKSGKWHDFLFHIKWSPKTDGFIQAWWNGTEIVTFNGMTENQDNVGPRFKFGLYRDDSPKTYVSYVNEVHIGNARESVQTNVNR